MTKYPQSDLIRHLFQRGQPLTFSKGELILGNDLEPNGVYFIDSGYIKVYSISNAGDQNIHIIYGSGELFPLMWAYLGEQSQSLFYEAIADVVVWRIARDWFQRFIKERPDVSYAMSQHLAKQFQIYSERLDNLEYKKASERIAYRLLFLVSRFGKKTDEGMVIDPAITHEVFSNSINLARESVSRELEKLEKNNIILLKSHHIIVKDIGALAEHLSRSIDIQDVN